MQSLCWISRRKPCFHYGQAVCLKPWHIESPCLPEHPPHVSVSLVLPRALASWGILLRHSIRPGRLLREHRDGFPRSECPFFCDLRMALYAGSHQSGHHALGYCMTRDQFPFGPTYQPFSRFSMTTLQTMKNIVSLLIVIHSHLLDGITASACSLPPFLPASDPRLPDARQGKVLSLHHLKDKVFTYMNTQLSRYNDLAAHPPTCVGFGRTGRTPRL